MVYGFWVTSLLVLFTWLKLHLRERKRYYVINDLVLTAASEWHGPFGRKGFEERGKTVVGSYRTSNQIYIFFIIMSVTLTIGSFWVVAPGRELQMAVFLAAVWGLILFILVRFKIEIYENQIRYRKLLFTHEVAFSNIAGFYSGENKPSLNRPLALEIRMKPGIKPSTHLIGFNLLSKDGQAHLLGAFRAKGIPEEQS